VVAGFRTAAVLGGVLYMSMYARHLRDRLGGGRRRTVLRAEYRLRTRARAHQRVDVHANRNGHVPLDNG